MNTQMSRGAYQEDYDFVMATVASSTINIIIILLKVRNGWASTK
jgi:hypothetical protein